MRGSEASEPREAARCPSGFHVPNHRRTDAGNLRTSSRERADGRRVTKTQTPGPSTFTPACPARTFRPDRLILAREVLLADDQRPRIGVLTHLGIDMVQLNMSRPLFSDHWHTRRSASYRPGSRKCPQPRLPVRRTQYVSYS